MTTTTSQRTETSLDWMFMLPLDAHEIRCIEFQLYLAFWWLSLCWRFFWCAIAGVVVCWCLCLWGSILSSLWVDIENAIELALEDWNGKVNAVLKCCRLGRRGWGELTRGDWMKEIEHTHTNWEWERARVKECLGRPFKSDERTAKV